MTFPLRGNGENEELKRRMFGFILTTEKSLNTIYVHIICNRNPDMRRVS